MLESVSLACSPHLAMMMMVGVGVDYKVACCSERVELLPALMLLVILCYSVQNITALTSVLPAGGECQCGGVSVAKASFNHRFIAYGTAHGNSTSDLFTGNNFWQLDLFSTVGTVQFEQYFPAA